MPFHHHPNQYTTIPARTPRACLGLAEALLSDAPSERPQPVTRRLERIEAKAIVLERAWNEASRIESNFSDRRPSDRRLDRAWRVSRQRNLHWAEIEDEDHGERATEIDARIFPVGLDFTSLPFEEEWAESRRRLRMIHEDGLTADFITHVGPRFVNELLDAHIHYGRVLGLTASEDAKWQQALAAAVTQALPNAKLDPDPDEGEGEGEGEDVALVEGEDGEDEDEVALSVETALRALREEMASYARLVIGLVDPDDDKAIAAAERQLAAIVRVRKPRERSAGDQAQAVGEPGETEASS